MTTEMNHNIAGPAPTQATTTNARLPANRVAGRVSPEALLRRAGSAQARSGMAATAARRVMTRLLARMTKDQLEIKDVDGSASVFGAPDRSAETPWNPSAEPLQATLTILDERAWSAVVSEGSIGLGRGYLEGWWTSDDPTTVVRIIIRNLRGLDDIRNRFEQATGGVTNRVRRVLPRPGRHRNREDIASHYDLGNDFFALFLDETMTYSSALFSSPVTDLTTASLTKYDHLLTKLGVTASTNLLEIGTGWGGLALRAGASIGCNVTTTTVSIEQQREAEARVASAGLTDRISILGRDWRDLTGRYDRIVSIEMIEAVDWRDYERFFATIGRCLKPDGMVGLQAICVPDRRYERTKKTEDFIRRFIFPGGFLPSIGAINRAVAKTTNLQVIDVEDFSAHYAETLRRWRIRFDDRLTEVRALGLDDRFCRLWRFYLAYCEAGFLERHCTVNQIVLAGPEWRPDSLTVRPC